MKKGSKMTFEQRKVCSIAQKKRFVTFGSHRLGKKLSSEQKKKMSDAHRGMKPTEKQLAALLQGRMKGNQKRFVAGKSGNPNYRNWQKHQWLRRKRSASGTHTFDEWERLKAQYNWTCPCCEKCEPTIKLSQDHIIPLSKGGSDNIENIQPLCLKCNLQKHTKTIRY